MEAYGIQSFIQLIAPTHFLFAATFPVTAPVVLSHPHLRKHHYGPLAAVFPTGYTSPG